MNHVTSQSSSALNKTWKKSTIKDETVYCYLISKKINHLVALYLSSKPNAKDFMNDSILIPYIDPTISNSIPDPFEIDDIENGVDCILSAIKSKSKIALISDYDVDGATCAALLKRLFKGAFDTEIYVHIPNRKKEGYGPTIETVLNIKEMGYDVLITSDCGTAALESINKATSIGMKTIILDHHISDSNPNATAVINPNKHNSNGKHSYLCGVGVCWMFFVGILKKTQGQVKNNLKKLLLENTDLACIGSICDMVPLVNLNRAFVKKGLEMLNKRLNPGVNAMLDILSIKKASQSTIGFQIGPMINAAGRIGDQNIGYKILSSSNQNDCLNMAQELNEINQSRMTIESQILKEIVKKCNSRLEKDHEGYLFEFSESWDEGVIGIIASRIKDEFSKPIIIGSLNSETKIIKTSCRSISGINIGNIVNLMKSNGIVIKGGGHEGAAGFSIKLEKVEDAKKFISEFLKQKSGAFTSSQVINVDFEVDLDAVTIESVESMDLLGPFGIGNPKPIIMVSGVCLESYYMIKNHIKISVSSSISNKKIYVMAFRAENTKIGNFILQNISKKIDLLLDLSINHYNGNKYLSCILKDIRASSK